MSDCFDHAGDAYEEWTSDRWDDAREGDRAFHKYPTRKHCDFCGENNLHWEQRSNGWKLVVDGTDSVHVCQRYQFRTDMSVFR